MVVVELGGNDGLRGRPPADIARNLRAILAKIKAAGVCPLLLGMVLPPSQGAEYTDAFSALYPKLAEELEVPFAPTFMSGVAGVHALNLEDGIHPTKEGQLRLAENVGPALERALAGCARGRSAP